MDYTDNLQTRIIRQQGQYIRQLEEQLSVYEEKDKAQELLIEKLNLALDVLTEELSKAKAETKKKSTREE